LCVSGGPCTDRWLCVARVAPEWGRTTYRSCWRSDRGPWVCAVLGLFATPSYGSRLVSPGVISLHRPGSGSAVVRPIRPSMGDRTLHRAAEKGRLYWPKSTVRGVGRTPQKYYSNEPSTIYPILWQAVNSPNGVLLHKTAIPVRIALNSVLAGTIRAARI
jgi:hypothetical protein